jgi:S-adenosylmethionine-diacylglycerol 3-amino-3-carboxypropyl transferase
LRPEERAIWDKREKFFDASGRRKSFYFRGTSGFFAWMINGYLNRPKGLREAVEEILSADSVEEQTRIYEERNVSNLLFSKPLRWALKRDATMAMLGVPRSQRLQIDRGYPGGLGGFIQDRIETVFKHLPLKDNYFWRVYLTGEYTRECCPEYLTEAGFEQLRGGLAERVSSHTNTVEGFLEGHNEPVSRFVLLDHMDWLYEKHPELLTAEWQSIVNRSAAKTRILWLSAALDVDFVDPLTVTAAGKRVRLGDLLTYHTDLANELHVIDRVHTYGSFYIADLMGVAA